MNWISLLLACLLQGWMIRSEGATRRGRRLQPALIWHRRTRERAGIRFALQPFVKPALSYFHRTDSRLLPRLHGGGPGARARWTYAHWPSLFPLFDGAFRFPRHRTSSTS